MILELKCRKGKINLKTIITEFSDFDIVSQINLSYVKKYKMYI